MDSGTVDLIATDPPFNKSRDFHATPDSLASGAKFQDRWSWERDVQQAWVDQIRDDFPKLMEAIESARFAHSDGMGAFMCFMAVRLLEMKRLLAPAGAIYLHCDPTASHYLKAVMDAIFGWRNFRNEIVWCYTGRLMTSKRAFNSKHEILLFYSRSSAHEITPITERVDRREFNPHEEAEGAQGRIRQGVDMGTFGQGQEPRLPDVHRRGGGQGQSGERGVAHTHHQYVGQGADGLSDAETAFPVRADH